MAAGGPAGGAAGRVAGRFVGAQEFYFRLLAVAESYPLNLLLARSLAAKLATLMAPNLPTEILQADFAERLVKLRVCARFLGWLRFAPFGGAAAPSVSLADHVALAERSGAPQALVDVRGYLRGAVAAHRLPLCVPWVVEYLQMLDLDPVRRPQPVARRPPAWRGSGSQARSRGSLTLCRRRSRARHSIFARHWRT